MGNLFGRRREGSDNSALIRALIASNEANHRKFLALMEQSEKSHKEYMKILSDEIQHTIELAEDKSDHSTADLYIALTEEIDKQIWMLSSFLDK